MRNTSRLMMALTALALVTAACGNDATPGATTSPSETAIPTVSIGECQTAQGEQEPTPATGSDWETQLKKPGVLSIGSDNAFEGFEIIPPGADKPVGFDVDLYTEIADRMGLEAESTTTDFDGLFTQSIPQGKFDLGIAAITIKEDRKRTVDFTIPYYVSDLSLAVNIEETPTIAGIDDLEGLTIGAQKGTTGEVCAEFLVDDGKAKDVKSYGDTVAAFQDLVQGRIAAVVNDRPASQGFVEKNAEILKVVQVLETQEQYAFAISKDKPDLREEINRLLLAIMEDGTYAALYEKWFETAPPFDVPLE